MNGDRMAKTFFIQICAAIDSGVEDADLATACHKIQEVMGLPLVDIRIAPVKSIFTRPWQELCTHERRQSLIAFIAVELSLALNPPTAEIAGQRRPGNATMN